MAVIVQQMIDSKKSGVLFTVDPVHGRKDRMVVEAAFGLGENVVDGEHTPDHYSLDRNGTIKRSHIVGKQVLDETELSAWRLGAKLENMMGVRKTSSGHSTRPATFSSCSPGRSQLYEV